MQRNELDSDIAQRIVEIPSHQERTEMALYFNTELKERASAAGFKFVDVSSQLIDKETGFVADCYKRTSSHTELEIHLDENAIKPLYVEAYREAGFSFDDADVGSAPEEAVGHLHRVEQSPVAERLARHVARQSHADLHRNMLLHRLDEARRRRSRLIPRLLVI